MFRCLENNNYKNFSTMINYKSSSIYNFSTMINYASNCEDKIAKNVFTIQYKQIINSNMKI